MKGFPVAATVATIACVLTACGGSPDNEESVAESARYDCTPLGERETVVYAQPSALTLGTYYQAMAGGYFDDENIEIEFEQIQSGQDAAALLGAGRLDAIGTGISAGLFAAIDAGVEIKEITTNGATPTGEIEDLAAAFFVRTDLLESGEVAEMGDLEGKNIAYPGGLGAPASWYVATMLASGDIDIRDTEHAPMDYADMNAAFESGAIDAAFVSSPFKALVLADGHAMPFGDQNLIMGHSPGGTFLGPNLLVDRPQVACAFIRAQLRATADRLLDPNYNEDSEVVEGFVEVGGFPEDIVRETPAYVYTADGAQNPETLELIQQFFIDVGVLELDEPLTFEEIVDDELREAALASIEEASSSQPSG